VYGRFCHICGQENLEPAESVWHLITHFFNDITHFDGKFFSTLKLLLLKPGFLSAEYKCGRRNRYLNPVKMYVFTSFIFFLVFFSVYHVDENFIKETVGNSTVEAANAMDSASFSRFTRSINGGKPMTRKQFNHFLDSTRKSSRITLGNRKFKNRGEYDSLIKAGEIKDGWITKKFRHKVFEINEKYPNNQQEIFRNLSNILMHNFPQMLFVSLPLFALFLQLLYFRHKSFYFVSHAIYTVHLYIFYFIVLLSIIILNKYGGYLHWDWLQWLGGSLILLLFVYEYRAMRNFYGQGRGKTLLKFFLAGMWRFLVLILLFIVFLFLSILKV
jgi:hypothetical protein